MVLVFGDAASFLVDVETSAKASGETFEKVGDWRQIEAKGFAKRLRERSCEAEVRVGLVDGGDAGRPIANRNGFVNKERGKPCLCLVLGKWLDGGRV